MASAPTDSMAMAASPCIFVSRPVRSSKMAQATVTPNVRGMWSVSPSTADTDMAPKATWDRPSPIKENLRSTSVTPSREEHRAMSTPTTKA